MYRLYSFIFFSAFIVLLSGCSTQSTQESKPKFYLPQKKVLLLPTHSSQPGTNELQAQTHALLQRGLQEAGFELIAIPETQWLAIEQEALDQSGSIYNPKLKRTIPYNRSLYLRNLIRVAQAYQVHFDAVIDTELLLRPAEVKKGKAQWDGIKERLIIKGDVPKSGVISEAKGVSLKLLALSLEGGVIAQSFEGVAIPYEINYSALGKKLILRPYSQWVDTLPDAVNRSLKAFYERVKG